MPTRLVTSLLAALTLTACAAAGTSSGPSRDADLITSEELRQVEDASGDMYEAIQRLRPLWLRSRGSNFSGDRALPVVYVSGSRYGELGSLRSLRTTDVARAAYMDPSTATTRFGTGHVGGVILITMHGGR